jgi:hypothetical protein
MTDYEKIQEYWNRYGPGTEGPPDLAATTQKIVQVGPKHWTTESAALIITLNNLKFVYWNNTTDSKSAILQMVAMELKS